MSTPDLGGLVDHRVLTQLKEIEAAAEEAIADKQEIVDLDRRRNANRVSLNAFLLEYRFFSLLFSLNFISVFQEALRAVEKVNHSDKKTWMAVGNCFFKLPTNAVKDIIKEGEIITPLDRILGEKRAFPRRICVTIFLASE